MTPDPLSREEMQPDDGESDATRRIHPGVEEPIETTKPEQPKGLMTSLREAYERARDGRRQQSAEKQPRTAQTVDRSKGLLVLAGAVVIMIFGFLAMFSSSNTTKDRSAARNKPNLGRPEMPAATGQNQGSVTPLLAADTSNQDTNGDQVSPEDVKATGRTRLNAPPKTPKTLANVPPMDDPALEAYRKAKAGYCGTAATHSGGQRTSASLTSGRASPQRSGYSQEVVACLRSECLSEFRRHDPSGLPAFRSPPFSNGKRRGSCRTAAGWWRVCRPQ